MTTWRNLVLLHFRPPAAHLSLVADPDGLLLEEQVLAALNARGYDLLTFADPIAFRYLYETRYRDQPAPALIVRTGQADARQLPYDLLQAGRQLSLTLHDLCPQLSYPVLRDFFRAAPDLLDTLLDASRAAQGERLSEQRSLGFLARHVYGLDPASLARLDDLVERLLHIHYHGWALLAVLPTVTPIARQALFAGQLALYFPDTWQRTDQDGRRWQRFWQDQGLPPSAAAWQLGGKQLDLPLTDSRVRALGLVIGDVDKMLHGTVHGRAELHARVRHWLQRGDLTRVVQRLLAAGIDLWLTSDHGNTAALGAGQPREGVLVEQRGSRVRFYSDPAFQARAAGEVPDALVWTPGGLPAGLLTLFAAGHTAFANQGEPLLTHGGLALEEVVVPWVHITAGTA